MLADGCESQMTRIGGKVKKYLVDTWRMVGRKSSSEWAWGKLEVAGHYSGLGSGRHG